MLQLPRQSVEIDQVKLTYSEQGQNHQPVLLCLHAIGHSADDFAQLSLRYQHQYRVIALDWPEQGHSGIDHHGRHLRSRYCQLLDGFIRSLELPALTIIGNSIGADTAIRFAAENPRSVTGLVLANPGGLAELNRTAIFAIKTLAYIFGKGQQSGFWYPRFFSWYYHQVLQKDQAQEFRNNVIRQCRRLAPVLQDAWLGFADQNEHSGSFYRRLQCPVLFTWAELDSIAQLKQAKTLIKQYAAYQLTTHNAGHSAFLESPDSFYQALEQYLPEVVATA